MRAVYDPKNLHVKMKVLWQRKFFMACLVANNQIWAESTDSKNQSNRLTCGKRCGPWSLDNTRISYYQNNRADLTASMGNCDCLLWFGRPCSLKCANTDSHGCYTIAKNFACLSAQEKKKIHIIGAHSQVFAFLLPVRYRVSCCNRFFLFIYFQLLLATLTPPLPPTIGDSWNTQNNSHFSFLYGCKSTRSR